MVRKALLSLATAFHLACGATGPPGPPGPEGPAGPAGPTTSRNDTCQSEASVRAACPDRATCVAYFAANLHSYPTGGISWVVGDNMPCWGQTGVSARSVVSVPDQIRVFFDPTTNKLMGATQPRCSMSFGTVWANCSNGDIRNGDTFWCF